MTGTPTRRRRRAATAGATVAVAAVVALALTGPAVLGAWGASPTAQIGVPFSLPDGEHLLGTDVLGRDVLARVLDGGASLLGLALGATVLAGVAGLLLGVAAASLPRRSGELLVRVVDVLAAAPGLLLVLVFAAGFPGSDLALLAAVALVSLPFSVRVDRAAAARVLATGYVEVARARGDGWWRVLVHDVAPNVAPTALTETGLRFVAAVQLIATASFLGLGAGAPAADWGRMVAENLPGAALSPWPFLVPALLLVVLAVGVTLLVDRLTLDAHDD